MDNHIILELAQDNAAMSDVDRLVNLYWGLSSVLVGGVDGAVVELGCHTGKTSVFLRMIIDHFAPERELHVYDSFEGLPQPTGKDVRTGSAEPYRKEGEFRATVEDVLATFARWDVAAPTVHAGWFEDTLERELPERVAFAYLDGDFYDSLKTSLQALYPRMTPGAIAIVDDYCDADANPRAWDLLPGAKIASDEFFSDKPEQMYVLVGSGNLGFGYVRKLP